MDAVDSSGYLVSYIESFSDVTNSNPLKLYKTTAIIDEIFQANDGWLPWRLENNFKYKFRRSFESFIPDFNKMLDNNYNLIKDSLGLNFGKDAFEDSVWSVIITKIYVENGITEGNGYFVVDMDLLGKPSSKFDFFSGKLLLGIALHEHEPPNYVFPHK